MEYNAPWVSPPRSQREIAQENLGAHTKRQVMSYRKGSGSILSSSMPLTEQEPDVANYAGRIIVTMGDDERYFTGAYITPKVIYIRVHEFPSATTALNSRSPLSYSSLFRDMFLDLGVCGARWSA